jgi:thiamine biosynthesis protein ThiI
LHGKVICLTSGGIDSQVAAWLTARKGLIPVFVYFDNAPFIDEGAKQKVLDSVEKLGIKNAKIYVVYSGDNLTEIVRNCPRNLTCVLCRRLMYSVAERIALKEGADALVTGEIIGEHASQTLRNLRIENQVLSEVTVIRPLIGMNKIEVENLARIIGTFDASNKIASSCKGAPPKPRTRARIEEVRKAERWLNIENMIERNLNNFTVIMVESLKDAPQKFRVRQKRVNNKLNIKEKRTTCN